jgi:DNA polymerase elongation subunit (family B)
MTGDVPVYGLDIETDTTTDGLDPRRAAIVAVAIASRDGEVILTGGEPTILQRLDRHLADVAPGVIATWNGAAFDLPFIADRARRAGVGIDLTLVPDPSMGHRRPPLPGHRGAYRARWASHTHLDGYRLYRADLAPALDISCSLKSIARLVGLDAVEVDATHIHDLSPDRLRAYVASDARLARRLVCRRWATAQRFCDDRSGVMAHGHELPRGAVA